jgi:hypothetical protein
MIPKAPRASGQLRLAMWSGPRNISTALMRSWGNRPDTFVCDEPFYACFLQQTRRNHPGRDEVIASQETDWRKVAAWLTGPIPEGKPIFYQKHMAHHLLPDVDRAWLGEVTNCFLIRRPEEVITSYIKKAPDPELEDTGFPQLCDIFGWVREHTNQAPVVLDTRDILEDPRRMLALLCDALGVAYTDAMLSWPEGYRTTDGVWAKYWYAEVVRSTTFQPYRTRSEPVPRHLQAVCDQCQNYYQKLYERRLR